MSDIKDGQTLIDTLLNIALKMKPGMKAQVPIWLARTLFFS